MNPLFLLVGGATLVAYALNQLTDSEKSLTNDKNGDSVSSPTAKTVPKSKKDDKSD